MKMNNCKYNGGALKLFDDCHKYFYADIDKWKMVFVPYNIPHEVSKVVDGNRYVIVTDICVKNEVFRTYEAEPEEDDIACGLDYGLFD